MRQMFYQVNFTKEFEAVAWVAVLVGFTVMLRVSNLGPRARKDFDQHMHFLRGDLSYRQELLMLSVRWAKNIQHRNQTMWCPLVPAFDKKICPEYWIKRMTEVIPASKDEPLFLIWEGKYRFPLTSAQVTRLLKQWAKGAGLDSRGFTAHCLCRGGLNWAHKARATGETLKLMGGGVGKLSIYVLH